MFAWNWSTPPRTLRMGSLLTPVAECQVHRCGQPAALHQATDAHRLAIGAGGENGLPGTVGSLAGLDQRAVAHPEGGLALVAEAVRDLDRGTADLAALGGVVGRDDAHRRSVKGQGVPFSREGTWAERLVCERPGEEAHVRGGAVDGLHHRGELRLTSGIDPGARERLPLFGDAGGLRPDRRRGFGRRRRSWRVRAGHEAEEQGRLEETMRRPPARAHGPWSYSRRGRTRNG